MAKDSFKKYLKGLAEDEGASGTTSADIATVDNKLDMTKRPKHLNKGKLCKEHKRKNCQECKDAKIVEPGQ